MSTLTLRIPDTKYERLKNYAKSKEISLNKLFDEFATIALTQFDAKTRFELMVSKADKAKGLALLDKLDKDQAKIKVPGDANATENSSSF